MGFRFERRASSRRARTGLVSWFARPPAVREVTERLRRLGPRLWPGAEVTAAGALRAELHPFAPPLTIAVGDDGVLSLRGEAGAVGPGYCDEAAARLAPVLDEIDYVWDDAGDVRDAMLAWLAAGLGAGETRIGMPEGRAFVIDAAVQTAMGPRDAAWRDAVIAEPRAGADAFAWWERGPGQLERSRALLAMWHEVPWREPIDKAEMAVMKRVDADLRAARKADDALALPYAEWAELVGHLGDEARATELRGRATGPAVIGYRRFALEVDVGGGWAAALPGGFTGNRDDSGGYYWATDGDRVIEVTTMETTESDSGKLLDIAPARHPVIERAVDGARHGRAEAYETDGLCVVYGLVAIAPHVAIVTCRASAPDPAWGLALWRSLHRA